MWLLPTIRRGIGNKIPSRRSPQELAEADGVGASRLFVADVSRVVGKLLDFVIRLAMLLRRR